MLSSVSYVCLGVCAGMWVISGGIYLGLLVLFFISVLLFQRSGHFCLFMTFYWGVVCVLCFYFADVFNSTMWSDLRAAVPQGSGALHSLASSLPDVALASRASSTSSKYCSSYNRWRSWAREHGLTVFPASPFHLAIYLRHLMTEARTASPLESAVHSIAWFHQLGCEPSPSDHPLVKSILAGAQRLLAHQTTKKEPITVSQLEQLVACKADSMASLYNIRSVIICLLAFAAFLRFDELAKLVRFDVKIENDMLKLFIQSSKTDQYRDGAWIVVASSGKATCPVAMMYRYLERAGLSCDSPLFCQLSKTKYGYKPRSKGLSYSRLRELVLEAFKDIVPDISAIGTHSLRSGGATAAANAGVPDRLFKRHGRWASESAKDGYVQDSLSSRLSVSKALGI